VTKGPNDWFPLIAEGGKAIVYSSFAEQLNTNWKVPIEGGAMYGHGRQVERDLFEGIR
jgi:hypothetical protein